VSGRIYVPRRALIGGLVTVPFLPLLPLAPLGCASKPAEAPLAHLYGKEWVHGSYELYAGKYAGVQSGAKDGAENAYKILAQKGVVALDALQSRDVPFYMRVATDGSSFAIERKVPERLTFTADMSEADRAAATAGWKKAREFIHADYEEIRRLNWALTQLLSQTQRIRNAIEEGRIEQYRLVQQIAELDKGGEVPFQLPYQVTRKDYTDNVVLLLERLEDDRKKLETMEASIVTVGLTARSTDAGSATLSASIYKVLVAVMEDADATQPRPSAYPPTDDQRAKYLAEGRRLYDELGKSEAFKKWVKAEQTKTWEAIGSFLPMLDAMTHLPISSVYKQVLEIWRGDADYLSYAKMLLSAVPGGKAIVKTVNDVIEVTEKARKVAGTMEALLKAGPPSPEALAAQAKGIVLNTGTQFARDRVRKQLAFFREKSEIDKVQKLVADSRFGMLPMPSIPIPAALEQ
jgi:hypothetical protein